MTYNRKHIKDILVLYDQVRGQIKDRRLQKGDELALKERNLIYSLTLNTRDEVYSVFKEFKLILPNIHPLIIELIFEKGVEAVTNYLE